MQWRQRMVCVLLLGGYFILFAPWMSQSSHQRLFLWPLEMFCMMMTETKFLDEWVKGNNTVHPIKKKHPRPGYCSSEPFKFSLSLCVVSCNILNRSLKSLVSIYVDFTEWSEQSTSPPKWQLETHFPPTEMSWDFWTFGIPYMKVTPGLINITTTPFVIFTDKKNKNHTVLIFQKSTSAFTETNIIDQLYPVTHFKLSFIFVINLLKGWSMVGETLKYTP